VDALHASRPRIRRLYIRAEAGRGGRRVPGRGAVSAGGRGERRAAGHQSRRGAPPGARHLDQPRRRRPAPRPRRGPAPCHPRERGSQHCCGPFVMQVAGQYGCLSRIAPAGTCMSWHKASTAAAHCAWSHNRVRSSAFGSGTAAFFRVQPRADAAGWSHEAPPPLSSVPRHRFVVQTHSFAPLKLLHCRFCSLAMLAPWRGGTRRCF
jgi:hypothetical protein